MVEHDFIFDLLIPVVITAIASSGFWIFLGKRFEHRSLQTDLLIGLAHDRIIWLGMYYVNRGWITQDEYENLNIYLYGPYNKLGGNGTAQRVMRDVDNLPIQKAIPNPKKGEIRNDVHE